MDDVEQHDHLVVRLVELADVLRWSDRFEPTFLSGLDVVRRTVGARLAPAYLLDERETTLDLIATDDERRVIGDEWTHLPASVHARRPWVNPERRYPVRVEDHLDDEGYTAIPAGFRAWAGLASVCVPIVTDDRHLGDIILVFAPGTHLDDRRLDFLAAAGRILGTAVHRTRIARRERELAALEERRMIGAEIHDDLAQQVSSVRLRVGALAEAYRSGNRAAVEQGLAVIESTVASLNSALRRDILALRQTSRSGEQSFTAELRDIADRFAEHWGIPTVVDAAEPGADVVVPPLVEGQLLRVVHEALTNVGLHAEATKATVRTEATPAWIRAEVEDDGVGFLETEVPRTRLGLRIMRERIEQVGGRLEVRSRTSGGTLVRAEIPLTGSWR